MFSYGGNNTNPELRPTELKGLMRYVYRITQQNGSNKELFTKESELFGSTNAPSPIRLQMDFKGFQPVMGKESLTLHRQQSGKHDDKKNCIGINSKFYITLRYRNCPEPNKKFYSDILRLSLYLSGMGKRTRRARGCVCIEGEEKSVQETREDILNLLNCVASNYEIVEVKTHCIYDELYIKPVITIDELRPIIQKICFGKPFDISALNDFILAVDDVGHTTKENNHAAKDDPTGTFNRASSIIVSVAKTTEGYLPIYTYVKAINNDKQNISELDKCCKLRKKFQNKIETKTKNGGK